MCYIVTFGTHNRAGEISYCTDDGSTYYFTITTYTDPLSCGPDRCELEIKYGDGSIDTIPRVNGNPCPVPASCGSDQGDCNRCGELISSTVKKNVYTSVHTYSGPGVYTVSMADPKRNEGIVNIPASGLTTFYIKNVVIINPFEGGVNCNPVLTFPPIDDGCVGYPYQHNPGAIDPEGDSLIFSLVECFQEGGNPIPGYNYPNNVPTSQGTLTIDRFTGTVYWDSPSVMGEYNICIEILEYRGGSLVGSVIRDMQLTIRNCPQNDPPELNLNSDVCVIAGDTVSEFIRGEDINDGDYLTLSASGEGFNISGNPAQFETTSDFEPVTGEFIWETECDNVRVEPYLFYFRLSDNKGNTELVDYETMEVKIIAPAPENPIAVPSGSSIVLNWDASVCSQASCYKVYRRIDSLGYVPDECVTGVPSSTGYSLIGTNSGNSNTSFVDDNNGDGLSYGQRYCYMIVACFDNGSESIPTEEFCTQLRREVPIMTRVSVNTTSLTNGSDTISWSPPIELDTTQWLPPYVYNVYRDGIYVGSTQSSNSLLTTDTIFVDTLLNTQNVQYKYFVQIQSSDSVAGKSQSATSIYLQSAPTDNRLDLQWTETVPWVNTQYVLFRENLSNNKYEVLDTVVNSYYSDTGLVNGTEYCYYVQSIGNYSLPGILNPIPNNSQEHCNIPADNVPPCPPFEVKATNNCEQFEVNLEWMNPNDKCADDVMKYHVYYSPNQNGSFSIIETIPSAETTFYNHVDSFSIAGCYGITALDSLLNESEMDTVVCVDNCPNYQLPLVFSPGGNGYNDYFIPFPYRYIKSVNITIYNRWGGVVFQSNNPDVLWDGYHQQTSQKCSEGVYYYVCDVEEIKLVGTEVNHIKGYVHLIWDN